MKTKIIPGEIITKSRPIPDMAIMRTQILDIATREQIDVFEFVSVWTSYKKDQKIPVEKRKLTVKNKLRMKNRKGKMIVVTLKTREGEIEKTESALKRLLARDGRYELANVMEATLAQQEHNEKVEGTNEHTRN